MTIPIEFLQQFVARYLPEKKVTVSYAGPNFKSDGETDLELRTIVLNPNPRKEFHCEVEEGTHHPLLRKGDIPEGGLDWSDGGAQLKAKLMARALKTLGVRSLTDDDFVLFTTLHEIGHFLFRNHVKVDKWGWAEFVRLRRGAISSVIAVQRSQGGKTSEDA